MDENKNLHQISIELDNDSNNGEYSNLVIVTHSSAEFVMDFTKILPGVKKAKVHSRIIMAPEHAKAFMNALSDNIDKFESKNGKIRTASNKRFENYPIKDAEDSLPN
tara:strand:+ start:250 stop:570 length:321 start_codon:yes stop_codon:yes gene_type:complete